jgi:CRISPR system Cascade subunit CasC
MAYTVAAPKIMIHVLHNFPPARMNSDESGSQKTAMFGDVLRARLSSPNIGRNVRLSSYIRDVAPIGYRSRALPHMVKMELYTMQATDPEFANVKDEFINEAAQKLKKFGTNKSKEAAPPAEDKKAAKKANEEQTAQVLFFTDIDVKFIANAMRSAILKSASFKDFKAIDLKDIPTIPECVNNPITIDMALFGRMVTSDFMNNVTSAVQIAHALSTHALYRDNDYYSCVDDLIESGEVAGKGSAMQGNRDFNSACFYKYSAIDLNVLKENMEHVQGGKQGGVELLKKVVAAYIKAFVFEYSASGQGRFAAQTLPDMVMIEVTDGFAPTYEYINAFETPVPSYGDNPEIVRNSVKALVEFVDTMDNAYDLPLQFRGYFSPRYGKEFHPKKTEIFEKFNALLDAVIENIKE